MAKVFISYKRTDVEFVRRLDQGLRDRGQETWVDLTGTRPAAVFMDEIRAAIEKADAVVFVLTPESAASEVCRLEVEHAARHNKRLIPIVRREVDRHRVPEALAGRNWIFFRDEDDFAGSLETLLTAIATDLEWVNTHTRLTVRASEWERQGRNPSYLLRGTDLTRAESAFVRASEGTQPQPTTLHQDYLIASRRDATVRQRRALGAVLYGLLFALVLAAYAFIKRNEADEATRQAKAQTLIATSRQLAALSTSERNNGLDRSLLLAVAAFREKNTFEARDCLFKALQDRPGITSFLHMKEGGVKSVAFSPDGKTVAAGYSRGGRGGVVLWDPAARNRLMEEPLLVKEGVVQSVAFSPDGKTIAAGYSRGGNVGGVVLWDSAARKRLVDEPLPVKEGDVDSVAFSPNGKTIAAGYSRFVGGVGGGVVLWDSAARNRLAGVPLPVKEGIVQSVAFSPDGKTIAAGYSRGGVGVGGGVVLWDSAARNRLAGVPLPVKEGPYVRSLAFSPDGKTIAAGYGVGLGLDGGVVLWDSAARNRLAGVPLPVKEGDVQSVAFSPDGKTIAAGYGVDGVHGNVGGVVLWDSAARNRLADEPLPVREGDVQSLAFSPDGKTMAAGYDVGGNVGGGGNGGGVMLWDSAARNHLVDEPFPVKEGRVSSVAFSPNGKTIAAGYDGGLDSVGGVVLWDSAARNRLAGVPLPVKEGGVSSVAFSPDGKTVAAGYAVGLDGVGGGGVVLWDSAARNRLAGVPLPVKEGDVQSVAFSPDGKTIAAGYAVGLDGVGVGGVVLWDSAARNRLADEPLPVREGHVESVAFSPDGKTIAAGCGHGVGVGGVVLWDSAARNRLAGVPLPVKEGDVQSVAFSPDGKTIAAGYAVGLDGVGLDGVVLWDSAARKRLVDEPLPVKEGFYVRCVAFSPDGKTIAAGYGIGVGLNGVVLWDSAARKRLVDEPFPVKEGFYVSCVAFSPDGKTIAAGCRDFGGVRSGVVLCDVDLESWQRRAGRIANRNFTRDEWRQYFPEKRYRATFPDLPVPSE